jgi:hypothetical protein
MGVQLKMMLPESVGDTPFNAERNDTKRWAIDLFPPGVLRVLAG